MGFILLVKNVCPKYTKVKNIKKKEGMRNTIKLKESTGSRNME